MVIGPYVVLDDLGRGGMGYVFKAQHRRMKRIVALKILPPASRRSPEAVQRFQREVETLAKLSHPNIVAAHDANEAHGTHFLVMEYVPGADLPSLLKARGPLPVAQVVDWIRQAAQGLQYAHGQGVIHRDIKPTNLLCDHQGTLKVLDLGLARLVDPIGAADRDHGLTNSGQVVGTVDYMAPEQALDARQADARSDVYGLGCTLYYLLTGRAPYGGESLAQKIIAHREHPIPSLRGLRPDVPAELDGLFQRLVAKQAEDRPQTMGEVLAELQRLPNLPTVSPTPEPGVERDAGRPADTAGFAADAAADTDPASVFDLDQELPPFSWGPSPTIEHPAAETRPRRRMRRLIVIVLSAAMLFLALPLAWQLRPGGRDGWLVVLKEPTSAVLVTAGNRAIQGGYTNTPFDRIRLAPAHIASHCARATRRCGAAIATSLSRPVEPS